MYLITYFPQIYKQCIPCNTVLYELASKAGQKYVQIMSCDQASHVTSQECDLRTGQELRNLDWPGRKSACPDPEARLWTRSRRLRGQSLAEGSGHALLRPGQSRYPLLH